MLMQVISKIGEVSTWLLAKFYYTKKSTKTFNTFWNCFAKISTFLSVYHQQMLVQGPTSILISNYHHLTKNIITFFHHVLTFFKEKSTFLRILITTKSWSFDHHFPPSLVIILSLKIMSISQKRFQNFGSGRHSARMYSSKT